MPLLFSCSDQSYYLCWHICTVLNGQICLSLSRWYIFKLHTLLSRKGGSVWQFYYSFCQRQLADESIYFHVPVNSHFELYIPITQAFEKMLSHTFICSVQQTATQLDGTQCNLPVGLGLYQPYKWRAKYLLGEAQRSGKDKIPDTSIFVSKAVPIWIAAGDSSGSWAPFC